MALERRFHAEQYLRARFKRVLSLESTRKLHRLLGIVVRRVWERGCS